MKWVNKWLYKKLKKAWSEEQDCPSAPSTLSVERASRIDSNGMNFTVYRANGGHIIEYRQYDRHKDRSDNKLHIITDDKDIGEELGKIITFESLRG